MSGITHQWHQQYELVISSNARTPTMWFHIESPAEIRPGDNLDVGTDQIDDVWEEDGMWVAEGQFGPKGSDSLLFHGVPTFMGFYEIKNWDGNSGDYSEDPVDPGRFDLTWDGRNVTPSEITHPNWTPSWGDDGSGGDGGGDDSPAGGGTVERIKTFANENRVLLVVGSTVAVAVYRGR